MLAKLTGYGIVVLAFVVVHALLGGCDESGGANLSMKSPVIRSLGQPSGETELLGISELGQFQVADGVKHRASVSLLVHTPPYFELRLDLAEPSDGGQPLGGTLVLLDEAQAVALLNAEWVEPSGGLRWLDADGAVGTGRVSRLRLNIATDQRFSLDMQFASEQDDEQTAKVFGFMGVRCVTTRADGRTLGDARATSPLCARMKSQFDRMTYSTPVPTPNAGVRLP